MDELRLSADEFRRKWAGKFAGGKGTKKHRDDEHRLQVACVRWFRYTYPDKAHLLFAVPNGGDRDIRVAQRLKAEGVVAGVADLLLLVARQGCHGLAIEMKTGRGRQSDSQREWQGEVERQGWRYVVCRSVEEFTEVVGRYLGGS